MKHIALTALALAATVTAQTADTIYTGGNTITVNAAAPFAEALKIVTHDNAQLLALSGPRNAYPGKLGVVEEGALADLLLVDGDPIADFKLIADPEKNFLVVMKDGKIHKNTVK